jgi:hypothetical protein
LRTKLTAALAVLCLTLAPRLVRAQAAPEVGGEAAPGQALTPPRIIAVLLSLSRSEKQAWQVTGDCSRHLVDFEEARPSADGLVSIQTGFFLFGDPDTTYESRRIEGPVFKYRFLANTCPPGEHQRDYDCYGEALIEVEVLSPKLVKIRQRSVRSDPNGYVPPGERGCVFQRR